MLNKHLKFEMVDIERKLVFRKEMIEKAIFKEDVIAAMRSG